MSERWIAGHIMERGACRVCGRAWVDIRGYGQEHVGQPSIACVGNLTAKEAVEIEAERARQDALIAQAFAGVGNG